MTPQTNTKSYDANMATILIILACAAILAFSLHAVVRLLLRLLALRSSSSTKPKSENQTNEASSSPVIFSSETRLARSESECAICLSEFVNGERLRVLPSCGHGFHASCVEEWIVMHSSCPTCRATCNLPVLLPEEP